MKPFDVQSVKMAHVSRRKLTRVNGMTGAQLQLDFSPFVSLQIDFQTHHRSATPIFTELMQSFANTTREIPDLRKKIICSLLVVTHRL